MDEFLTTDQKFISKLTDIIHANIGDENFGVKELAQKSGMSLKILRKRLNQVTKKTINQFIRDTRLRKALEMLQNESYTVSEVAYRVGFSSPVYFIKCFHQFFGFPPGKVRKGDLSDRELILLTGDQNGKKSVRTFWERHLITFPGIMLFVVLIVAIGFVLFKNAHKSEHMEDLVSSDGRISIAIMPFQNNTKDTLWNIWQEGIQNELISSLSNYEELQLKQSEPISRLIKAQGISNLASLSPNIAGRISKKLDAGTFLFGRILKAGSSMRVIAQLTDSKTKEIYKSFKIERPSDEKYVFEVIDSLSLQLVNYLLMTVFGKDLLPQERRLASTRSPDGYRFYINGLNAFMRHDFSGAVDFYRQALKCDSDLIAAASDLSYAYGYLGQEDQSRYWCLWLYKRKESMSYFDKLWIDFVYANNFETPYNTIKCLERLQEYDDRGSNYHFLLGTQYLGTEQFDRAVVEFRKSFEIFEKFDPKSQVDWDYTSLGLAYHKAGQYKNEEKLYKRASKLLPESTELLYREAVLALTKKDTSAAGEDIKKYKTNLKNNAVSQPDILTNLARIYSEAKIPDKAEEYYRLALSLEPDNPVRINNLSFFLIDNERNISEGLALADRALSLKPDNCYFLDTKGWGLYKQGDFDQALKVLQKSWDLRMKYSYYDYKAFQRIEQARIKVGSPPS